jgi:hypothetical protein
LDDFWTRLMLRYGGRVGATPRFVANKGALWRKNHAKQVVWVFRPRRDRSLLTEVWRSGASRELSPADSVLKDQTLELENGAITASQTTGGTLSLQTVTNNNMASAGQLTYRQVFLAGNLSADPSNKPKGRRIGFNGTQLAHETSKPQFTTSKYNFHFNLGCTATGAATNAGGGSNQIAANEGCLNQWMTNSIWRVRVTAFSPYPPDAQPQDQTGGTSRRPGLT